MTISPATIVLVVFLISASFFTGCAVTKSRLRPSTSSDPKPRQDEAIELVWHKVFKMNGPPPIIIWVERHDLDCNNGNSFYNPLSRYEDRCVNGLFFPFAIMVAWPNKAKFSDTAFVHELVHAKMWVTDKKVDMEHLDTVWFSKDGDLQVGLEALQIAGL